MMFLARAEDPGLLVLPTHRLVKDLPDFSFDGLCAAAAAAFDIAQGDETTAAAIEARLARDGAKRVVFAVRAPGRPSTVWLTLKPILDLSALGPPTLRNLDVTVLHGVILGPLLAIDAEALAKQSFLTYTHDTAEALARVDKRRGPGGVLHERDQGRAGAGGVRGGLRAARRSRPTSSPSSRPAWSCTASTARRRGRGRGEMTGRSTAGSTDDEDITADTLRGGRVRIYQPARGARMSLDPVLLEGFLPPPHGRFLDIGCGTGALSFLLLARDPAATGRRRRAAAAAGGAGGARPRRERLAAAPRDRRRRRARAWAIASARRRSIWSRPTRRTGRWPAAAGRPTKSGRWRTRRSRWRCAEWVACAARAVRPGGRVAAIFPAERAAELLAEMRGRDLIPCRLRSGAPARRRAGVARAGGGGARGPPPAGAGAAAGPPCRRRALHARGAAPAGRSVKRASRARRRAAAERCKIAACAIWLCSR